ncbi:hypothetical protein FRC03_005005 [Tulasnella sp. 419]|nr:hypothetical protein FRC03_005005 [Tulasnella sp. 419]
MALQLSESNQAKLRALREALDALRLEGGYQSLLSTAHAGADTTGSQGSKDVSALVNRIDEEIAILRVHVAQVHRQIANHCQTRNQLSPIHRLPPEVLLDILQTATLSDYDVDIQLRNQLSLEQVCSHWRKLMDSVPRIFGGASHSRNARVVSETGDLPIHVVVGRYNGKFLDFSERHIHRWASLRVDKSVPEDWLKHFRSAAPLLRAGKWIEVWSKEGYRNGQVALGVQWEISDTSTFEGSPIDFLATTIPFWTHQIRILELRDGIRYKFPEHYGDTIGGFVVELVELEKLIVNHDTMKATSIITILGSPIVGKDSSLLLWPCPKLTCLELKGTKWLNVDELSNCLRSRYGVHHNVNIAIGDLALPVRLEKLGISPDSICPESMTNASYDSAMIELSQLVGNDVVE